MIWLGQQLVLEAFHCRMDLSPSCIRDVLLELPPRVGLTVVSGPILTSQVALEDGTPVFTGVVILAESHLALHSFPLERALHVDLFSCKAFDAQAVKAFLRERLLPERVNERGFDRHA